MDFAAKVSQLRLMILEPVIHSLNMIKKVDLNVIKIDKSFIPMETEYPGKENGHGNVCQYR